MKTRVLKVLLLFTVALLGAPACGADGAADPEVGLSSLDPVAEQSSELASGCSHMSYRWLHNGCCTQTATRLQRQICIYGTWYWENVEKCYFPTSCCGVGC